MGTVTIGGNTYDVYGDAAGAVAYATAMLGAGADAWLDSDSPTQARSLVSATRMLDRQEWATDWATFAARNAEPDIVSAAYELAVMLLASPDLQADANAGSKNVRRVDAKGVSVEFFGRTEGGRFPTVVQELVGPFLASASAASGNAVVEGASDCSQFEDRHDFDLTDGY